MLHLVRPFRHSAKVCHAKLGAGVSEGAVEPECVRNTGGTPEAEKAGWAPQR